MPISRSQRERERRREWHDIGNASETAARQAGGSEAAAAGFGDSTRNAATRWRALLTTPAPGRRRRSRLPRGRLPGTGGGFVGGE